MTQPIRIGINGFGRIGRACLRRFVELAQTTETAQQSGDVDCQVVTINEPAATPQLLLQALQQDAVYGRFPEPLTLANGNLQIGRQPSIQLTAEADLSRLDWPNIDILWECSGTVTRASQAAQLLQKGCKKVLLSNPADQQVDATLIYGVNEHKLSASAEVVSSGSCTSNCIAAVIQAMEQLARIEAGSITTLHSMMNDQATLDEVRADPRRSRAGALNIVPVSTALAVGIERIFPHLKGRFSTNALRVPTLNTCALDICLELDQAIPRSQLLAQLQDLCRSPAQQILGINEQPLVSLDLSKDSRSAIIDADSLQCQGRLVKFLAWFDNEWGFVSRMLDCSQLLARQIQ